MDKDFLLSKLSLSRYNKSQPENNTLHFLNFTIFTVISIVFQVFVTSAELPWQHRVHILQGPERLNDQRWLYKQPWKSAEGNKSQELTSSQTFSAELHH